MKTQRLSIKIYQMAIIMSFVFGSCDGPGSELTDTGGSGNYGADINTCYDNECLLLTENFEKSWILNEIISPFSGVLPLNEWSVCDKTEILTFCCNNTLSANNDCDGLNKYFWSINNNNENPVLKIEGDPRGPNGLIGEFPIYRLSLNTLVININGQMRRYVPLNATIDQQ